MNEILANICPEQIYYLALDAASDVKFATG